MKPILVGLLAVAVVLGVAYAQFASTGFGNSSGSNWGILSLIGVLVIISALFGNRGTNFKVVFGNFTSKSVDD